MFSKSKKVLSLVLAVLMMLTTMPLVEPGEFDLFSVKASAADTLTEGYYTYTVTDGKATITNCDMSISGDVVIPDTLGGYPVVEIGLYAFSFCKKLEFITIPNSVTRIGSYAFDSCSGLASIDVSEENPEYSSLDGVLFNKDRTNLIKYPASNERDEYAIPDSVKSIKWRAFDGCKSLTHISIPDSVTDIDNTAFGNCNSLASINVAEENSKYSSLDGVLFNKDRTKLIKYPVDNKREEYIIPDGVIIILDSAFSHCSNLINVSIPDSVTSIGGFAFESCVNLMSITIPMGVTEIESYTFFSCKSLVSVTIPDSVTIIGNYSFQACSNLASITIPNSVKSIKWCAFEGCKSLTHISIPDSVTSIGGHAFSECTSLTNIIIPDSVTSIGGHAFSECTSLTNIIIPDSVISIDDYAFSFCTGLTSVKFGTGVTSIGDYTFRNCNKLTSVTIPKNVTSIGTGAIGYRFSFPMDNFKIYGYRNTAAENYATENGFEFIDLDAHEHGLVLKETIAEPTCTQPGSAIYVCDCGYTETKEIPALGHNDENNDHICDLCGVTVSDCVDNDNDHYCDICGKKLSEHTWNNGDVITEATCTENGEKIYTCTVCGETETEMISALGHETVIDEAVAPACEKQGLTQGSHCSRCGEVFVKQEVVAALEHHAVELSAVDPTCTKTGLTAGVHCDLCGKDFVKQEVIPAKGHSFGEWKTVKEPTSILEGSEERVCSECGFVESRAIDSLPYCSCFCHKTQGRFGWFFKIILFICKIFRLIPRTCPCGAKHW